LILSLSIQNSALLVYLLTFSIFRDHQVMISITASSSKRSDMNYILMLLSSIRTDQSVRVLSCQEKSKVIYECHDVGTLYSWHLEIFDVANLLLQSHYHNWFHVNCHYIFLVWKYLLYLFSRWNLLIKFSCDTWTTCPVLVIIPRKTYPFVSSILSSGGACTFRRIISYQWPLGVVYDIVTLINSTLLTSDMIPLYTKGLSESDD
jgi:hypothetical protein